MKVDLNVKPQMSEQRPGSSQRRSETNMPSRADSPLASRNELSDSTEVPWTPPIPPRSTLKSKVTYWQRILEIPLNEPSAPILRQMAAQRLMELGAMSETEANGVLRFVSRHETNSGDAWSRRRCELLRV